MFKNHRQNIVPLCKFKWESTLITTFDVWKVECRMVGALAYNRIIVGSTILGWDLWITNFWLIKGHFTHEPRAVTMKLWEPQRKCPKAVPTHLHNHAVWSRTLECSVKSYVTRPSTKRYFNELLFTQVLTHDKTEYIHGCERSGCHGLPVYVRPIPKTWFLQTIQVTMKHDPFDAT